MTRPFLFFFWLDFFFMMLIPFLFVLSARFGCYSLLDRAAQWASLWLLFSFIFIGLAAALALKIRRKPTTLTQQKNNSKTILLITGLCLFGFVLGFLRNIFSVNSFWDFLIAYWIVFVILLFRGIKDFITQF